MRNDELQDKQLNEVSNSVTTTYAVVPSNKATLFAKKLWPH